MGKDYYQTLGPARGRWDRRSVGRPPPGAALPPGQEPGARTDEEKFKEVAEASDLLSARASTAAERGSQGGGPRGGSGGGANGTSFSYTFHGDPQAIC